MWQIALRRLRLRHLRLRVFDLRRNIALVPHRLETRRTSLSCWLLLLMSGFWDLCEPKKLRYYIKSIAAKNAKINLTDISAWSIWQEHLI